MRFAEIKNTRDWKHVVNLSLSLSLFFFRPFSGYRWM